ncbi:thermonuclease family protein [Thioclava atlantica]|uniref:Succinoglycan biosynthesis protein Ex n=1 Tax=Thioclava atlantica TaxID=1317124 RepID=A0A085TXR0_9RHOB|nr:hypothetical protein [Thioclava atlantica]KFE35507.1 succinoglycan biosynthesis protein Ex [Thioclava atlantica]
MPFTDERADETVRRINFLLASRRLKVWERNLLQDALAKFERHGNRMQLSTSEAKAISKLISKNLDGNTAQQVGSFVDEAARRGQMSDTALGVRLRRAWIPMLVPIAGIALIAFVGVERGADYIGPLSHMLQGTRISGPVMGVQEGNVVDIDGRRIRMESIDCPAPAAQESNDATAHLRKLVGKETVTCEVIRQDGDGQNIGSCVLSDGRNLAALMVLDGYCHDNS